MTKSAATNFALVTLNVNNTLNVIGDSVLWPGALGAVGHHRADSPHAGEGRGQGRAPRAWPVPIDAR
jgi:hypothetical protein